MKLIEWVRFSWDFADLPALDLELPQHYRIESGDDRGRKTFAPGDFKMLSPRSGVESRLA